MGLVAELEKVGATIIVATPALSEIMIRTGVQAAQTWITEMNKSSMFKIVEFDIKSAIEVALMAGHTVRGEGKRKADNDTYAKLKYDRQIVAIAHTEGASIFYTDDKKQKVLAQRLGMVVRSLADCPIPETEAEPGLNLEGGRGDSLTPD